MTSPAYVLTLCGQLRWDCPPLRTRVAPGRQRPQIPGLEPRPGLGHQMMQRAERVESHHTAPDAEQFGGQ